jgi:hypothetical protein
MGIRPWDLRLCKSYDGADDPQFRKETLEGLGRNLQAMAQSYFDSEWTHVLEALKLHPSSMPGEAAARALELLSPEGLGRNKELQAIAAWLGRDRESLKLTGASPLEAIGQAFTKQWEDLQRAKKEGRLGASPAAACRRCAVDRHLQVADERSSRPLAHAAALEEATCISLVSIGERSAANQRQPASPAAGGRTQHRPAPTRWPARWRAHASSASD